MWNQYESIWMWNQYEGYNKVIIWFVISKKSNYCQIAEANSPLNLKPCSLALLSLLQKGQHQLKIKELFPILITTIHNYERKNIIEEEAKIWESENLWQGYISSPSHASLSIPPSQPEDNISFKATPTVLSQQIQNSLISSNDQMNRPGNAPHLMPVLLHILLVAWLPCPQDFPLSLLRD